MGFLKRVLSPGRPEPVVEHQEKGIFAGLFVATPEQLESWNLEGLTPAEWPAVQFKRLDPVKLGMLEAILTHGSYDDIDQNQLHILVRQGGPDGPWVIRVRKELVTALAELTPALAPSAAAQWADTDEFKLSGIAQNPEELAELTAVLVEMAALAQNQEAAKALYLLMAL